MLASMLVTGRVGAEERVSFIASRVMLTGGNPVSLAVGDFNSDRLPDVVMATLSSSGPAPVGDVAIWLGQADATFAALPSAVAGISPRVVEVGDVNGDGRLGVIVATASPHTLLTLLSQGNGTFQALPPATLGGLPAVLRAGGINGDGWPDLAVANASPDTLTILLNNTPGSPEAAANLR